MESAVIIPRDSTIARVRGALLLAGIVALVVAAPVASAQAQGMFDFFFGNQRRTPSSANSYADPNSNFNPYGDRQEPRVETGPSVSFCVRTCDGRYFPIQRSSGVSPAQTCSSFCPAAKTKIFSGGAIEHASASDGSRYKDMPNAFAYRDKIVAGCTCNGKDAVGLVVPEAASDPTLQAGDIVVTDKGFMAYSGGSGRRTAEFTPLDNYSGPIANDFKKKLAGARIVPRNATSVTLPEAKAADDAKRVQLDR